MIVRLPVPSGWGVGDGVSSSLEHEVIRDENVTRTVSSIMKKCVVAFIANGLCMICYGFVNVVR